MKKYLYLIIMICIANQLRAQNFNFKIDANPIVVEGADPKVKTEKDINMSLNGNFPSTFTFNIKIIEALTQKEIGRFVSIYSATKWVIEKSSDDLASLTLPTKKDDPFILKIRPAKGISSVRIDFMGSDSKPIKVKRGDSAPSNDFEITLQEQPKPEEKETAGTAASFSCTISDPSLHYFTPPVPLGSVSDGADCVSCLNDYKVVYDLSSPETKICYFKRSECACKKKKGDDGLIKDCNCPESKKYCYVPKEKIRPTVGSNVGFHFFGYYPYYDSVGSSFSFESRNLEQRDAFGAALNPSPTTSKETPKETTKEEIGKSASKKADQIENDRLFFDQMRKEFSEYFNYLLISSPDMALVQGDINHINSKLGQYCLIIREFSQKGLFLSSEAYLARYDGDDDLKKKKIELMNLAKKAALFYGFIINYHSVKIPVVQIKNEDQFQWTMDFYKNKKKIDSRLYTMMISGGWKIDFSSGFVLNNLIDNKYTIQYDKAVVAGGTTPVDAGKIVRQDEGKWLMDVGLMAHVYPRTGYRVNAGLASGIVIRNGTNVKYLVGPTLMFGYEQRFIISGGVIMGQVDVLDATYNDALNTYVDKTRLTTISSSVPTTKKFEFGTFLSISYNLGGTTLGAKQGK